MNPPDSTPEEKTRIIGPQDKPAPAPPRIPDHQLLRCIGYGSYGEVWLARNVMGTYRAVKVVYRASFEQDRPYEREFEGIQKFEPISRSHPSQVNILHVGRNDAAGYFYYVMELADGQESVASGPLSVASAAGAEQAHSAFCVPQSAFDPNAYEPRTLRSELKRRGRLPFAECLDIALALTTALEHLHKHGLIHRDIKPANIVFVNGIPKLADIGLVTETGDEKSFVGTEGYFPPEGPGAPAGDIYGLGKVLYEMAMGRDRMDFPELPTNLAELLDGNGLVELNEVILKACAKDVGKRYKSASEMNDDLVLLKARKSVKYTRDLERRLASIKRIAAAVLVIFLVSQAFGSWHLARLQRYVELQNAEASSMEQKVRAVEQKARAARAERYAALSHEMMGDVLGPLVDALKVIGEFSRRAERPGQEELLAMLMGVPKHQRAELNEEMKKFRRALEKADEQARMFTPKFADLSRVISETEFRHLRDQDQYSSRHSAQDLMAALQRGGPSEASVALRALMKRDPKNLDALATFGRRFKLERTPMSLDLSGLPISDLSAMAGVSITSLKLSGTGVTDIGPLRHMPLNSAELNGTPIRDLSPLSGALLRTLRLENCPRLEDLTPLLQCRVLENLTVPTGAKIEVLRQHPRLKRLGYTIKNEDWVSVPTVKEFWAAFDQQKGQQK